MLIIILTLGNSACVLLEGEAEDGDLLVGDRVEEALHDALGEAQSVMMAMIFHLRTSIIMALNFIARQ